MVEKGIADMWRMGVIDSKITLDTRNIFIDVTATDQTKL